MAADPAIRTGQMSRVIDETSARRDAVDTTVMETNIPCVMEVVRFSDFFVSQFGGIEG